MVRILVIGAGVTGGYTAARLSDRGADVTILARGEKAVRLEREGLKLRDGISGFERIVRIPIVKEPVTEPYDLVMACVQEIHRPAVERLAAAIPGRPIVWFLGNTTRGYVEAGALLGRERVIGGFPSVGGTWKDDVLVYADRRKPEDEPFDTLIAGEAFPEGGAAMETVAVWLSELSQRVDRYQPIMAWHLCHAALILPLAGLTYSHGRDRVQIASDRVMLKRAVRGVIQGFAVVRRNGYPILPSRIKILRFVPRGLVARKVGELLTSRFGEIALAGHADTARDEMKHLAADLLALGGPDAGKDFRELLGAV